MAYRNWNEHNRRNFYSTFAIIVIILIGEFCGFSFLSLLLLKFIDANGIKRKKPRMYKVYSRMALQQNKVKDFSGQVVSIAILAFYVAHVLRPMRVYLYVQCGVHIIPFPFRCLSYFIYMSWRQHEFLGVWKSFVCGKCEHCLVFLNMAAYQRMANRKIMTFCFFCVLTFGWRWFSSEKFLLFMPLAAQQQQHYQQFLKWYLWCY